MSQPPDSWIRKIDITANLEGVGIRSPSAQQEWQRRGQSPARRALARRRGQPGVPSEVMKTTMPGAFCCASRETPGGPVARPARGSGRIGRPARRGPRPGRPVGTKITNSSSCSVNLKIKKMSRSY